LRLPTTIGTTILSLAASAVLIAGEQFAPHLHIAAASLVAGIDFNQVVLHGMLALLLFAGALQMDIDHLYRERLSVLSLAVVATVLSTVVVAVLFKLVLGAVGVPVSITTAVLFGALISPTDPIAVLEMLRRVGAPPELEFWHCWMHQRAAPSRRHKNLLCCCYLKPGAQSCWAARLALSPIVCCALSIATGLKYLSRWL
jgi:NhaP-type Na+/H+ or K+/H+ antiporter